MNKRVPPRNHFTQYFFFLLYIAGESRQALKIAFGGRATTSPCSRFFHNWLVYYAGDQRTIAARDEVIDWPFVKGGVFSARSGMMKLVFIGQNS